MKKLAVVIGLLMVLLISATASAATFRLEPGDPHWVKKEDPSGVLYDMGDYWESRRVKGDVAPKIYFKLPEVVNGKGVLTFYYGKDIPASMGWDKLQLFASKDGTNYQRIWSCPEWGPVDKKQVVVTIPAGYQYLYFQFNDGNYYWETLRLWKSMDIISSAPSPTPTPTPTPIRPPTTPKPIPGFEVAFAIAGIVAVAYLLNRRGA